MKAIQHPSNNDVLAAPPGVAPEDCSPLYITRVMWEMKPAVAAPAGVLNGTERFIQHGVVSFWLPDEKERALLMEGKPIRFLAWGRTHPPISIGVDGDGWPG